MRIDQWPLKPIWWASIVVFGIAMILAGLFVKLIMFLKIIDS